MERQEGKNRIPLPAVLAALAAVALVSALLAVGIGPVSVSPRTTVEILIGALTGGEGSWTQTEYNIVVGLRLPRVLLGLIVGASLAVTGVTMQALVRNRLADPFILGVSSGASAFATLDMVFGVFAVFGRYALSISAFLGAAVTIMLVYLLSRVRGRVNITHLLLSGVAIAMVMDAVTRFITLAAPNALGIHNATFWMAGSLAGAQWAYLTLPFAAMAVCLAVLLLQHRTLNALLLGEEAAGTLGVNVARTQTMLIVVASVLAGTAIAVSGTIGFVGLMVPHITRLLVGSDHKRVLPVAALMGGIFLVWADVAARLIIAPEELPVGILTAILGGPCFIWLLKRGKGVMAA